MDISVIIPAYNSSLTIERCLRSLALQKTTLIYEIIVVDSSADRETSDIVKSFSAVNLIRLPKATYAGIARNIGVGRTKGELLAFIDSDIVLPPGWLTEAFTYYKKGRDLFCGSVDIWKARSASVINKLEWFYEFSEFKPSMKEARRWCLSGMTLCVKKSIFDNEAFMDIKNSEDTEFTVRLAKKGHALYFYPCLKASHIFKDSYADILRKAAGFGRSNMYVRRIHEVSGSGAMHSRVSAIFAIPFFAVFKFIKISWRNIRYNSWGDKLIYVVILPLMAMVISSWMIGAYRESLNTRGWRRDAFIPTQQV